LVIGAACLFFATIPATGWADTAPCERNFTVKDGFFGKKIYKTWQDVRALTRQTIFKRAYAYLVKGGWVINLSDMETGVITASQVEESSGGAGKVASLNIFIENSGNYFGGVPGTRGVPGAFRVTMTFSVPNGLDAHEDMVRHNYCDALAEIKDGTYVAK
jgi:hypothetical protein